MPPETPRAQLTIDFLTGMAVFFIVIGFTFAFTPGLLGQADHATEAPLAADRVASQLVEFHLGTPSTAVLDTSCTIGFLTQSSSCDTFDTSASLTDQLGIDDRYQVNVTLRRNVSGGPDREILCADSGSIVDCSSGGTSLAVGPSHSSGEGSIATAQRHVTVDGTNALLEVQLW